ncbi:hypothetical protein PR017_12545 [Rhizobium tumorigenes]|uniref:Uncharacterized protein n=2 Tax=Rhizobium tumorigenes TaxID=2041385 RepID=A0AAF1K2U6_9HYPH|nr:hypothetical protein [Rhizobium tumorigenes]WFR94649.1 hypothetical protein PR017_12545 [Rhizobium tumorigenes]
MRALLRIFRLPRKLVMIVGGVALLMGSSGAFALYIGRDRLLGPSTTSVNGMQCTDLNLVTIRKNHRVWLRKYITADATDGLTRIKTALRVAKAVYDAQKPDLVQVVVLDKKGPTLQSDIHGRALGATVVYIPHPEKIADGTVEVPITARYYNGGASDEGLFFGDRVDMTSTDIDGVMASLKDHSDCTDPVTTGAAKVPEGGKHPKTPPTAEGAAKSESGEEKSPAAGAPPAEHPPAAADVKPEQGSTGSFIGVKVEPKIMPTSLQAIAALPATSDAVAATLPADPQMTGTSR